LQRKAWLVAYISLQEIQARAMVPKHFSQAYPRMLHLKKEEYVMVIWPTNSR